MLRTKTALGTKPPYNQFFASLPDEAVSHFSFVMFNFISNGVVYITLCLSVSKLQADIYKLYRRCKE